MLLRIFSVLIILSILIIASFSGFVFAQNQQTVTLGAMGQNTDSKTYQSLVSYIASKLGNGTTGRVFIANNASDMINHLKSGQVDLYVGSSLFSALLDNKSGAIPFLRVWTGGVPSYHSVFITRKDSPIIYHFFDVYGKTIGFSNPYSSPGYLLPKAYMIQKGFRFSPPSPSGDLFVLSTGSDNNTLTQVLVPYPSQKVDVGAISSTSFNQLPNSTKLLLKVVNMTYDVPNEIVSYNPGLSSSYVNQIKNILLNMNSDPTGLSILKAYSNTTKIDAIPSTLLNNFTKITAKAVNGTVY